jgi:hypothetical protein
MSNQNATLDVYEKYIEILSMIVYQQNEELLRAICKEEEISFADVRKKFLPSRNRWLNHFRKTMH